MPSEPWGAAWIVTAPWAHPIWHTYCLNLCDLTTDTGSPVQFAMPGATHDFLLMALDPNWPTPPQGRWVNPDKCPHAVRYLTPPNYGYQFKAGSNDEALARIEKVAELIRQKQLSPDTDWRRVWDTKHFADAAPLVRNALDELVQRSRSTLQ